MYVEKCTRRTAISCEVLCEWCVGFVFFSVLIQDGYPGSWVCSLEYGCSMVQVTLDPIISQMAWGDVFRPKSQGPRRSPSAFVGH